MNLGLEYRDASVELAEKLTDLPKQDPNGRRRLYLAILLLLRRLRTSLFTELRAALRKAVQEQYARLQAESNLSLSGPQILSDVDLINIADDQNSQSFGYFERSLVSIRGLAASLQSGDESAITRFLGISRSSTSNLKQKLRDGLIVVLAQNGRYYHYSPEYYAELVKQTAEASLSKTLSVEQARKAETDLVQIVGPPSEHALCAGLVGKIFSISGTHPIAPPLSMIGTGAPTHPFCRHRTVPLDVSQISHEEFLKNTEISAHLAALIIKEIQTA